MVSTFRRAFTLIELLVVVAIFAILIALLLPMVQKLRQKYDSVTTAREAKELQPMTAAGHVSPSLPLALVKKFTANVQLTPRLSVGTVSPESIYEASFSAKIEALGPQKDKGECEIELPLPPRIISLADLSVTAAGKPSELVAIRNGRLVWRGALSESEPTQLDVKYTAVGKGLYELSVPPGGILDHFQVSLSATGSDVRLLELSLQPTDLTSSSGTTTYTWDYQRLIFGQPVRLDVLGIAPIDRLGELTWLGPVSVMFFGLIVGLVVRAFDVTRFDRWMLLFTVGIFAGAYPLMFFAQEYISLNAAVVISAGVAVLIIAVRAITLMSPWLALAGVVLPAIAILTITIVAAIWPNLQGILLTAEGLAFFMAAMLLFPRIRTLSTPATNSRPSAAPIA